MNESETNDIDAEGQAGSSTPDTTPEPEEKTVAALEKERVFIGTGLFWGLVFGVLLAVVMIILAAQNTDTTTIKLPGLGFLDALDRSDPGGAARRCGPRRTGRVGLQGPTAAHIDRPQRTQATSNQLKAMT